MNSINSLLIISRLIVLNIVLKTSTQEEGMSVRVKSRASSVQSMMKDVLQNVDDQILMPRENS